ncbi:uncharacterized protein EAF01_006685 [Botrytis porri]|uniref:uncharacterized protein n=1 Tax=Botrytis porri TaxID=87229 RepID=UPI001900E535|nr:uncharacterized protein EAF01_006685 [Botrytis porri]KAF7903636.1 hypothetical protein EAF01_006685 [Botrytis porri]
MRLRSGLDKSSERDSRSQPAQAASLGMEEYRFTDFGSNGADFGSSRQNGSPSRPETQSCETSHGQQAQGIVLSSQHEEHQETTIALSHHTQRPYSAPPSSYDPTLYPGALVPVLYPTTSALYLHPYITTTTSQPQPHSQLQVQQNYSSHMPPHTNVPQPESIYTYDSHLYPYPPPPPAPTPPPPLPHFRRFQPSQYEPQAPLPCHQAQTQYHLPQTQPQPQTHHLPSMRPNFPPLPTLTFETHPQTQQPHHQSQDSPWSPLSAHESRKRRASDALSNAGLGVPDADVEWGYKDKMSQELDSLEMESRSLRRRDEQREGSARGNDLERSRRSRRRRRLNDGDVGNGSAGRRQGGRDEDENENENENENDVGYEGRIARGEEESDRGNGHAFS